MNEAVNDVLNFNTGPGGELLAMATEFLPKLGIAIVVWILFWFIAKAVRGIITSVSNKVGVESIADKAGINDFFVKANITGGLSSILGKICFWIIYLFGINIAFNTLGLEVVSDLISDLIAYIPNLIIAVILILIGTYIAKFTKDIINGAVAASDMKMPWAGQAGYIIVMLIVLISALNQAQIDISFLTDNVNTIVMGIMLAFGLAFGLGGQEKAKAMLDKWFK